MNPSIRKKRCSQCKVFVEDKDIICRNCQEKFSEEDYQTGYQEGWNRGYSTGYKKGFEEGIEFGSSK